MLTYLASVFEFRNKTLWIFLALFYAISIKTSAQCSNEIKPLLFSKYDENSLGYTADSDDKPYFDIKLSVKFILYEFVSPNTLYLGFTGKFAQYVFTRHSAPVLGKAFNPKIFMLHQIDMLNKYVEIGYAHESNGQEIDSLSVFNALYAAKGDIAYDNISRGWDYIGITYSDSLKNIINDVKFQLNLRWFLNWGILQGYKDDIYQWEKTTQKYERNTIHGISIKLDHTKNYIWRIQLETGIKITHLKGFSAKVEAGKKIGNVPIIIWASTGNYGDLAQFYKRVNNCGIKLEFIEFN